MRLFLSVHDTGVGIPLNEQEHVFEPFSQASSPEGRHRPGTGLGLSIVRQLVEMMGGSVHLRSVPGSGTDVHLLLWLGRDRATPWPVSDSAGPLAGARVLVADASKASRQVFARHLKTWRSEVLLADSATATLRILRQECAAGRPLDLVLGDSELPPRGAEELAQRLLHAEDVGTPHLVLVAPVGSRGVDQRTLAEGIRSTVTKPVRRALLRATLIGVLESDRRIPTAQPSLFAPPPSPNDRRFMGVRVLVAEDNTFNQEVMARLLEGLGCTVALVANGTQAVRAVGTGKFDLIFMDVQMPGTDGLTATRTIRAEEGGDGPGVPIVAMTAYALEGDRERCLAAGMDDYLTKPATEQALAGALERWVGSWPTPGGDALVELTGERAPSGELAARTAARDTAEAMVRAVVERFAGDVKFAADIASVFLRESPAALQELDETLSGRRQSASGDAAHRLKGMLVNLGAPTLPQTCAALEAAVEAGRWDQADALSAEIGRGLQRLKEALQSGLLNDGNPQGAQP